MLNEYAFCPRLFHFMHVEGLWAENEYTLDGQRVHKRVDKLDHVLPDSSAPADVSAQSNDNGTQADDNQTADDEPPVITRSVPLSSEVLGLSAKLDLVSSDSTTAVPVETKRGKVPNNADRSYEPERVQLMAQGLLLREHGYTCDHGFLYYAGSRTRVLVQFTPELEQQTLRLLQSAIAAQESSVLPPPLDDSPKCAGCSLNAICLPDETLLLQHCAEHEQTVHNDEGSTQLHVRRLYPIRPDAVPFYIQEHGAIVGKSSATLTVKKDGNLLGTVAIKDISQLVLCGNVLVTTQATQLLCERGIPIVHSSIGHWFYGVTTGFGLRNAYDREAQFRIAQDNTRCLEFAKALVAAKCKNQRTMLRRNAQDVEDALHDLARLESRVSSIESIDTLLGLEGAMARIYFQNFSKLFKSSLISTDWDFTSRNRRPPLDPINAMLSFSYALLVKDFTVALHTIGLDPWWGLYHTPKHGKPALALDMMEPYRPLIADSVVMTAVNTGMVSNADFTRTKSACMLKDTGRKALLRAYENRMDQLITHPAFGYKCSWRSALNVQARLLSRWLRGDVPTIEHIVTR